MHLLSVRREVCALSALSGSPFVVPLRDHSPHRLGHLANFDSYASLDIGIGVGARLVPEASSRTERAPRLRRAVGRGSTMHRAGTQLSRATSQLYNLSAHPSSTTVNLIFVSFFAPYRERGLARRTDDHAIPRISQPECQQPIARHWPIRLPAIARWPAPGSGSQSRR